MKLLCGRYENFGSYKELSMNFSDAGLALISGPTGSGKSTVMDAPSWCLFGITSKGGAVDEVRSWLSDAPTVGVQVVETRTGNIEVTRIRGTASDNDLFWLEARSDEPHRGKDLNETQKLLEARLGVSAKLWLVAVYLSQFSDVGSFFVAKAKERRTILEEVADLSLAVRLGDAASKRRKGAKEQVETYAREGAAFSGQILQLERILRDLDEKCRAWENAHIDEVTRLHKAAAEFKDRRTSRLNEIVDELEALDQPIVERSVIPVAQGKLALERDKLDMDAAALARDQAKLSGLQVQLDMTTKEYNKFVQPAAKICPACLGPSDNPNRQKHLVELSHSLAALGGSMSDLADNVRRREAELVVQRKELRQKQDAQRTKEIENEGNINSFESRQNEYRQLEEATNAAEIQLQSAQALVNPHNPGPDKARLHKARMLATENTRLQATAEQEVVCLNQLYDLSVTLRGRLLDQAVSQLERATNEKLERHFDARIRVEFVIDEDKVDVVLQRDGYECSFRQLSGGERCMLKLAFGISLMQAAADRNETHFDVVFLDEPLAGLDEDLKVKAFGLFQELAADRSSVFVIEHAEGFKSMFQTVYLASSEGDGSRLTQVTDE